ncbi:MAG: RHS repeat-associated core domain-containing protein [Thiolinea sp.]
MKIQLHRHPPNNTSTNATRNQSFGGKSYDYLTGLSYFGARYYDPVTGRFMAVDPVEPDPERSVHTLNRYAYANNNPYKYVDPNGRVAKLAKIVFNVGKKTYKNGGDVKKGVADEISNVMDNLVTLFDGQATTDDIFATIDLVTGFGKEAKSLFTKKTVVLGGNMEERVKPQAEMIGGTYYKPRGEWSLPKNRRWAKEMKKQVDRGERAALNIGNDPSRSEIPEALEAENKIFGFDDK